LCSGGLLLAFAPFSNRREVSNLFHNTPNVHSVSFIIPVMSMLDYESARSYIDRLGGDFEGTKSEYLVLAAEEALGLHFPPTYRQFLHEFGCGDVNGIEIYGIIDNEFEDAGIPDAIWLTLELRRSVGLDLNYVAFSEQGDGSYYVLDTGTSDEEGENPVILVSVDGEVMETLFPSFGAWLLSELEES